MPAIPVAVVRTRALGGFKVPRIAPMRRILFASTARMVETALPAGLAGLKRDAISSKAFRKMSLSGDAMAYSPKDNPNIVYVVKKPGDRKGLKLVAPLGQKINPHAIRDAAALTGRPSFKLVGSRIELHEQPLGAIQGEPSRLTFFRTADEKLHLRDSSTGGISQAIPAGGKVEFAFTQPSFATPPKRVVVEYMLNGGAKKRAVLKKTADGSYEGSMRVAKNTTGELQFWVVGTDAAGKTHPISHFGQNFRLYPQQGMGIG